MSIYFNAKIQLREERAREEAILLTIIDKLVDIYSEMTKYYRHMMVDDPKSTVTVADRTKLWKPLSGPIKDITFSGEELIFAMNVSISVYNGMKDAASSFRMLNFLTQEYGVRFERFTGELLAAGRVEMDGRHIAALAEVKKTDLVNLVDIQSFVRDIVSNDRRIVMRAFNHSSDVFRERFGRELSCSIETERPGGIHPDFSRDKL